MSGWMIPPTKAWCGTGMVIGSGSETAEDERTPDEILEQNHQDLEENLSGELLGRLQNASPSFLEKVVVELLVTMGYGGSRKDAVRAVGCSGDDGIDGVIEEDRLGLDAVYIQAKRWWMPITSTKGTRHCRS